MQVSKKRCGKLSHIEWMTIIAIIAIISSIFVPRIFRSKEEEDETSFLLDQNPEETQASVTPNSGTEYVGAKGTTQHKLFEWQVTDGEPDAEQQELLSRVCLTADALRRMIVVEENYDDAATALAQIEEILERYKPAEDQAPSDH